MLTPEKQCSVVYEGKSYPQYHGTRCTLETPHPDERHFALTPHAGRGTGRLAWWTEAEKQTRRAG